MARTLITALESTADGLDFVIDQVADATNGMEFLNGGNELLFVKNAGTTSINVTVDFKADSYGRDGCKVVAVAAGATKVIGSFFPGLYNQNSKVLVDFSADASVTVKVVKLN
jgi:hypothetical protein